MTPISFNTSLPVLEARLFSALTTLSPTQLRENAQAWAAGVAAQIGVDDKSGEYRARVDKYLSKVRETAAQAEARVILNELAEGLEAQLGLATYLHEVANSIAQGQRFFTDKTYPESRWISNPLALVQFLRKPLDASTIQTFLSEQPSFPAKHKAGDFYNAFWALPFTERVDALKAVLGADAQSPKHADFNGTIHALLNSGMVEEFLPADETRYGAASAHQIGKQIARAHVYKALQDSPELVVKSVASIMDALREDALDQLSAKPRTTDPAKCFGFRLGRFMNNHGPGAHKATQLGHSLPGGNEKWLAGLAESKSEAGRPTRLEFLHWTEALPDDFKKHILRIGAHRGTGSWVSTYALELDPDYVENKPVYAEYLANHAGKGLVLSLLKPGAKEDGLVFIKHLLDMGGALGLLSPEAAKNVAPLLEIIKQAERIVGHETDLRNSIEQEKLAREFLAAIKFLSVNNHVYSFYTQDAFDCGQKFRVSINVGGAHFNKLPENSEADLIYKRQTATVLFTLSVLMRLRGRQFNHDFHGDNEGITRQPASTIIGLFDSGAIDTRPPTLQQIEMFADCLVNTAVNSLRNGYGFPSSLKHTIAKTSEAIGPDRQDDLDFINAVLRASISDGDYARHMRSNDFVQAGLAILAAYGVDQGILSRLSYRLANVTVTKGSDRLLELGDHVLTLGRGGKVLRRLKSVAAPYARFRSTDRLRLRLAVERGQEGLYYPHNPNPMRGKKPPDEDPTPMEPTVNRKPGGKMKVRLVYQRSGKTKLSGHAFKFVAQGLRHVL